METAKTFYLNDGWRVLSGNGVPVSVWHESGIPEEKAARAALPCFAHMALEDHTGVSWYQKRFTLNALPGEGERAVLFFESADFRCEPSLNGRILGVHTGCEDPFSFDVTPFLRIGENRLTVRVSKPWAGEETTDGYTFAEVPHRNENLSGITPGACYNESGISGEVTLRFLPACRITDLFPEPEEIEAGARSGSVRVRLTLHSDCETDVPASLRLTSAQFPDGEELDSSECGLILRPGDNELTFTLTVPSPKLWSAEEPHLYLIAARLDSGSGISAAQKRTGFRTFRVGDDGYFTLNGRRILLKCSHTGNCMPESTHMISREPELLRKDFSLAKAAGFNCIRFISGAALPLQLDLCDELGLMIYEEPLAGWLTGNGPHAEENYLHDLLSMVKRDRSHPCVTVWGLLNETFLSPSTDIVCEAAKNALPALRELDPTRLVIYSSGRWDWRQEVGSVCNPYEKEWQTLWNGEGMGEPLDKEAYSLFSENDHAQTGDLHYYPSPVPMNGYAKKRFRAYGKAYRRPVFLSESGIGSLLDTISLVNRWEQAGIDGFCPDVKMVRRMNDELTKLLRRLGLDEAFPFPSEFMRASMENHAYYRSQLFDLMRSNPYLCGVSLTGLLDHSICGEGLWTLFREYKPGIADVLQSGFAPLRWCLIPERSYLYRGEPLRVEAVLANEDILKTGVPYSVRAGVVTSRGVRDLREFTFTVTEETAKGLSVPVFEAEWDTSDLTEGEYRLHVELLSGADAKGGDLTFRIGESSRLTAGKPVFVTGMNDAETALLTSLGAQVKTLAEYDGSGPVLCGRVTEEELPALTGLLNGGGTVIALRAAERDDRALLLLSAEKRPALNYDGNWLYHKEYLLSPVSPVCGGLETGVISALRGSGFLPTVHFDPPAGAEPDETWGFTFCTGYPTPTGFVGGYLLGKFALGRGSLILNAFDLTDGAAVNPDAARLLCNLIGCAG